MHLLGRTSRPPSRFTAVMPLLPPEAHLPGDQSEPSSSSDKDASSAQSSDDEKSSPDSKSDDEKGADADNDASSSSNSDDDSQQQQRIHHRSRSYSSESFGSSVSSALSFSATSSSDEEDRGDDQSDLFDTLDPKAAKAPLYRRQRGYRYSNSSNREITMQAIRNADTVGFLALLIPIVGISTMVVTEGLACSYHFDCTKEYPTLSYAATFRPEGTAFMIGMCGTAFFILVSSCLFYWFLKLRLNITGDTQAYYTSLVCIVAGVATAVTLAGLAIMDMRSAHDAHITFTVLFFISSWVLIVFCHLARQLLLLQEKEREAMTMGSTCLSLSGGSGNAGVWASLKRWRKLSIPMAFTLGRLFILAGIASTVLFGLLFLCVNGSWPNPLGFTAVQEAFFEAFAIVCQLFFMGTLSCELSMLTREVEARDYMELERRE